MIKSIFFPFFLYNLHLSYVIRPAKYKFITTLILAPVALLHLPRIRSLDLLCMNSKFRFVVYTGFLLGKAPKILYDELVQAHGEEYTSSTRTVARGMKDMRDGTFTDEKRKPPGRPRSVRSFDLVKRARKLFTDDPRKSLGMQGLN